MQEFFDEGLDEYVISTGPIPWSVVSVVPLRDYQLVVGFSDGTSRHVDLSELVMRKPYLPLADQRLFMKARVEHGTVVWGEVLDVAPEYLYERSSVI